MKDTQHKHVEHVNEEIIQDLYESLEHVNVKPAENRHERHEDSASAASASA